MKILAIDTASARLLAAVGEDGKITSKRGGEEAKRHNSALIPLIDEVLKAAGLALADIDGFAAVSGPGSFTGIRVGVSAVNAFSHAAGKPAVGVGSLEIAACASPNALIAMPAGGGNFYILYGGKKGFMTAAELENCGSEIAYFDENYPPETLIKLAEEKLAAGIVENPVTPEYLRKSQAERLKDGSD